jgi:hypothetical protein
MGLDATKSGLRSSNQSQTLVSHNGSCDARKLFRNSKLPPLCSRGGTLPIRDGAPKIFLKQFVFDSSGETFLCF